MCPIVTGDMKTKKFNYFYAPYNYAASTKKFMTFDEIEVDQPPIKRSQSLKSVIKQDLVEDEEGVLKLVE